MIKYDEYGDRVCSEVKCIYNEDKCCYLGYYEYNLCQYPREFIETSIEHNKNCLTDFIPNCIGEEFQGEAIAKTERIISDLERIKSFI